MKKLRKKLEENQIEVIFTDYYDTLVHRKVHPNYVLRIWAKIIINELGLNISIDNLYFTFNEALIHLGIKLKADKNELPYGILKKEVCTRLNNINVLDDNKNEDFLEFFEKAHLRAEILVQYLNEDTVNLLKQFKEKGNKIYLISDFYAPKSLFIKLLEHHGILGLFDGIYISASVEKSKHTGTIYKEIIEGLSIDTNKSIMIGDNKLSDTINAEKAGLHSYLLPHDKYLRKNKLNSFGNDKKKFKKIIKQVCKSCNLKKSFPYLEYAIVYHFFVERLYLHCKKHDVKSLFFLSREGLFLKRLFDSYLEHTQLDSSEKIRTHYLKVSRQASLQISFKNIDLEEFRYLKRKYKSMSVNEFLSFFNFDEEIKNDIVNTLDDVKGNTNTLIKDFFNSGIFKNLKENKLFRDSYENHRMSNKKVFSEYLDSFDENILQDGINVVDIGWGGTMQEAIYNFFNQKIKVTGLYLGLNEVYNLNPDTKRYGLNFSIIPYESYSFHILRSNLQLYEQFASAGHGSCVEYKKVKDSYTVEYHEKNDKWLYENFIHAMQDEMFETHKILLEKLKSICYNQHMVSDILVDLALKTGIKQSIKKVKFLEQLNSGFFENISNKKTGLDYVVPKKMIGIRGGVGFLLKPEKYLRYVVKLKHKLYKTNKILAFLFPSFLLMSYYKFNRFMRYRVLCKLTLLKFNYFR